MSFKPLQTLARCFSSAAPATALAKTPLYNFHLQHGATIVPYAGFAMPVLYKAQSHIQSHNWVRENAGLFDVSHMLQQRIHGPGATEFLQRVTPANLVNLAPFTSTLSVLLTKEGGVVDDTMITKHAEDDFYVVTNAGCRDKDIAFLASELDAFGKGGISTDIIDASLIAFQGPKAATILQSLTSYDLSKLKFGTSAYVPILGSDLHVARSGYTGEDGFEISVPDNTLALSLANTLLENPLVQPIGLAARDSLRLEAGLCLYGHELSESITPVEAGLSWLVDKSRSDYNGADKIVAQIKDKSLVKTVRRGITVKGPAARENMEVFTSDGQTKIGTVTSGSLSPTLKQNIGMAYLPRSHMKIGTDIKVNVRGKLRDGKVVKMPFVQPNYYR